MILARRWMHGLFAVALTAGGAGAQGHTRVSVGDHSLDVVRGGAGGPAIVFETGLADSLDVWLPVWRSLRQYTTVIAYSRAGFGRSDAGPADHSVPHAATDLHELLRRLGVRLPVILVARSYGSLISRLYTSLYPADVAGLVLVDGTHEQQVRRFGTIDPAYPREFRAYFDSLLATEPGPQAAEIRETVQIQEKGTIPGLTPLPDIPLGVITSMQSDESAPYVIDAMITSDIEDQATFYPPGGRFYVIRRGESHVGVGCLKRIAPSVGDARPLPAS